MSELSQLSPQAGTIKNKKRVGRGESSGLGKTAGVGHKGQKARQGKGKPKRGFEGGQMPLYRRLPKRGFNNARFKKIYAVVNVGLLEESFEDGAQINEQSLRDHGIVKGKYDGIKILGDGDISKKFNISANKVSHTAKDKIEKAGGSVESIVKNEDLPAGKKSQPKEDA